MGCGEAAAEVLVLGTREQSTDITGGRGYGHVRSAALSYAAALASTFLNAWMHDGYVPGAGHVPTTVF